MTRSPLASAVGLPLITPPSEVHADQPFAVRSKAFGDWLDQTAVQSAPQERVQRLQDWAAAPSARVAHPREEHLIPLMVAVGAAEQEPGECVYHEEAFMGGLVVSSYRFGAGAS